MLGSGEDFLLDEVFFIYIEYEVVQLRSKFHHLLVGEVYSTTNICLGYYYLS